jgi:hypothetical protein
MPTTTPLFHGLGALLTLALLAGCGPAPSDEAFRSGATAGAPTASEARQNSETGSLLDLAASPAPTAPARGEPSKQAAPLVVPAWMAKDLASPDVRVRLTALDRWVQQGHTGAVDPLLQALEDQDERVQARALELIVQDWVRAQPASAEREGEGRSGN